MLQLEEIIFHIYQIMTLLNLLQIEGPHPSGNVGVILNRVNPINQNEVVWTVQGSHLPILGRLFSKGEYDFSLNINVAGPSCCSILL